MTHLPSTAGRCAAARRDRPWHRSGSSWVAGDAAGGRSRPATPAAQQVRGERVPQQVRPFERGIQASAVQRATHHAAHGAQPQAVARRVQANEDVAGRTGWPRMLEIVHQGRAHIGGQREPFMARALAAHEHLAAFPIHVVQGQGPHFTSAQPESRQEQEDRVIPHTGRRPAITAAQQALDVLGRQRLGQVCPSPLRDRGQRRGQVPVDRATLMEEAHKGAQRRDRRSGMCTTDTARFTEHEAMQVPWAQILKAQWPCSRIVPSEISARWRDSPRPSSGPGHAPSAGIAHSPGGVGPAQIGRCVVAAAKE